MTRRHAIPSVLMLSVLASLSWAQAQTAVPDRFKHGDVNGDGWLDLAIGCDNIKNALGGFPHSRLYVFVPESSRHSPSAVTADGTRSVPATFLDARFVDIGGSDLVPDFGGFYHDSAKDKAGPGIGLRDLDNDGDLDLLQSYHVDVREPLLPYWPGEYRQGVMCWKSWRPRVTFESQPGLTPKHPAKNTPYFADSVFADFDNDGWLDVVVMNRSESTMTRSMLFLGKGGGTFEVKPTTFSGLDSSGISAEASDLDLRRGAGRDRIKPLAWIDGWTLDRKMPWTSRSRSPAARHPRSPPSRPTSSSESTSRQDEQPQSERKQNHEPTQRTIQPPRVPSCDRPVAGLGLVTSATTSHTTWAKAWSTE